MEVKWTERMAGEYEKLGKEILEIELNESKMESFVENPSEYLKNTGLVDPCCTFVGKKVLFSEAVSSAEEAVRVPVARTLLRRLDVSGATMEEGDPVPQPRWAIPIANAVAFFNAIYLANGMIYYNINHTENGLSTNMPLNTARYRSVQLSENYQKSSVFQAFDLRGYSAARQGAIMKSLIMSSCPENALGEGSHQVNLCHDGMEFTVAYECDSEKINICEANMLMNVA